MTVGDRIKARRKELGISADELAKRLGKNRATIYRYESNDIENFPVNVLEPLAKALDVTPAYLMGWIGDEYGDSDFLYSLSLDIKSGRLKAEEDMYKAFGDDHSVSSIRIQGKKTVLLHYHPFDDKNSATVISDIITMLEKVNHEDLKAIRGMIIGYLNRQSYGDIV